MRLGSQLSNDELASLTRRATSSLVHRGPDDSGVWTDGHGGIFLGHRRLAVVDLSINGHQPMTSRSGRWTISYNGEAYNRRHLLESLALDSKSLRGSSDTEVIVEALDRWGFEATLKRLSGMFALAAWDQSERRLWLARDRFGEKPLYYSHREGFLVFGSEIRAVRSTLGVDPPIDRQSLDQLFRYGYTPAPHSIFEGIHKLRAGHLVSVGTHDHTIEPREYWSASKVALGVTSRPKTLEESTDELEELLLEAIASRMESDVPLGAFLSGGIDSSLIVAMMTKVSSTKVRSFTIGFEEDEYNEAPFARQVAQILGSDHTETILGPADALAVVPKLATIYDEPFADSSQIPTWLVCHEARHHVTVALSGDGGDELFGGYDRYRVHRRIDRQLRYVPRPARQLGSLLLSSPSPAFWNGLASGPMGHLLPAIGRKRTAEKARKLATILRTERGSLYERLHSSSGHLLVDLGSDRPRREGLYHLGEFAATFGATERAMILDTTWYLPEDLLTKVDRSSMSVSLEVRAPFLDEELFSFAWSMPRQHRVGKSTGKVVLRNLLRRYLPDELIDRPKAGFGVPIGRWLREDLRSWADDLLSPKTLDSRGLINSNAVSEMWTLHRSGKMDLSDQLWPVLVFQSWSQS